MAYLLLALLACVCFRISRHCILNKSCNTLVSPVFEPSSAAVSRSNINSDSSLDLEGGNMLQLLDLHGFDGQFKAIYFSICRPYAFIYALVTHDQDRFGSVFGASVQFVDQAIF